MNSKESLFPLQKKDGNEEISQEKERELLAAATVQVLLLTIPAKVHDGYRKCIPCSLFHLPSQPLSLTSLLSSQPKSQKCFVASVRCGFAFFELLGFFFIPRVFLFCFDSVT